MTFLDRVREHSGLFVSIFRQYGPLVDEITGYLSINPDDDFATVFSAEDQTEYILVPLAQICSLSTPRIVEEMQQRAFGEAEEDEPENLDFDVREFLSKTRKFDREN